MRDVVGPGVEIRRPQSDEPGRLREIMIASKAHWGYDRDWVEAGARRVAYYTNTAPGRYTFRVMASNNDGVWSTQDATLPIVIIPPFWRTWWFLSGVVAAVAGLAAYGYRYRIWQLEQRQAAQAAFAKQLIGAHESERAPE